MLFNSLQFLVFFPLVTAGYFLLPQRARWGWLLAASCWFYMAFVPVYVLILFFTIVIDYVAGILIAGASGRRRKIYLLVSIVANCSILAVFKYYDFLNDNVAVLFQLVDWSYPVPRLGMALPIGLSFHTFQAMSYTIEVYRGRQPPERHFGIYALYVMFYPQLVAGPIERPQNLLGQFRQHHRFDYARVTSGLQRMTWGMFKKVAIADRLAIYVNQVYDTPQANDGATLILATVFFAFQIYCDFSGYSDIALGAAEVMGFRLMENFRRPYFSKSVSEFWTRWHISLSTWFRDYVYIPLGGNRVPRWRWYVNVMIVFAVSGLWHGASWTFVIWGVINGLYIATGEAFKPLRDRVAAVLGLDRIGIVRTTTRVALTFALTCLAWVFFRAQSLNDALYIVTHAFNGAGNVLRSIDAFGRTNLLIALLMIGVLEIAHLLQRRGSLRAALSAQPFWLRWSVYYAAAVAIILFGYFSGPQAFIYFQF
jgi:alginate O-acetyltransferase complex protein AlgI